MSQRELYRAENLPLFQNKTYLTLQDALESPVGDVVLAQDDLTGLVSNIAFDPSRMIYDADYQNEQACSSVFQLHLDQVTDIVGRHFRDRSLIEVGCGKGHFLEHLRRHGYQVTGVDPAYEGDNPEIIKAPFEPGLGVSADGIILRHVLEHIPDPVQFLSAISQANGGHGKIYIEVPCFDWIMQHRAWFDIFYEHVNYFRLNDFRRMFGTIYECGHVFGGQYLFVVADLATLRKPNATVADNVEFPSDFMSNVNRLADMIKAKPCVVWGGASKGVIFSLFMQRSGVEIGMAIDINPAKQGRVMPCSGVRIFEPHEAMESLIPGDIMLVMNSNYLDEIVEMSLNRFCYIKVD